VKGYWLAFLAGLSILITSAAAILLVHASWSTAERASARGPRLVWTVAAYEPVEAGETFSARLLHQEVRRVPEPVPEMAAIEDVVSQVARYGIPAEVPIRRDAVGPSQWGTSGDAVLVPISVDNEFATGLHPKMRIVLVRAVDKKTVWAGVPQCGDVALTKRPGYEIAWMKAGDDKQKAVVVVQVSSRDTTTMADLSDGVWRPIVVDPDRTPDLCVPSSEPQPRGTKPKSKAG